MTLQTIRLLSIAGALVLASSNAASAKVISGDFVNWRESTKRIVGDGVHHVTMLWSINTLHWGWFYGSEIADDSDVAFAPGVSSIHQISNAGLLNFTPGSIGPHRDAAISPDGVGDFIVWRHKLSGHYGVLRIDDIDPNLNTGPNFGHDDDFLQGRWWFQTDGSGDFSSVPEPATSGLVAAITVALAIRRTTTARPPCRLT